MNAERKTISDRKLSTARSFALAVFIANRTDEYHYEYSDAWTYRHSSRGKGTPILLRQHKTCQCLLVQGTNFICVLSAIFTTRCVLFHKCYMITGRKRGAENDFSQENESFDIQDTFESCRLQNIPSWRRSSLCHVLFASKLKQSCLFVYM